MFKLDEGPDSLEIVVGKMLQKANNTIACAESCTGGLLMGDLLPCQAALLMFREALFPIAIR